MKVLIAGGGTGGHLMPALALADAMRTVRRDVEPVLVGAERGIEAAILPQRADYPYHLLPVEPIHRRQWWKNARWLRVFWTLRRRCRTILEEERPVFAVGTGGYAAGPILFLCQRWGIPVALQEQNAMPGFTTRRLARRAAQIHLGFPEAREHLRPGEETEVFDFGNPIVPPPARRPSRAVGKVALGIDDDAKVCFVMGGSQGARSINQVMSTALRRGMLEGVTVLWSTGPSMWDHFAGHHAPPHRIVKPFWDPVAHAYAAADLVVGRAGAMTTAELSAWGLPAILIPLPTAAADHQSVNADALQAAGSAIHVPDSEVTAVSLAGRIRELLDAPQRLAAMSRMALERAHPDASMRIATQLLALAD
ncbi:MAG: UDP-N-acetylglucosamine--N-acetylmuramyl-(pentapeptide) pyrophosphoryl-undecaprenol N-acetylglucosamine transferase [Gemmatimonadetes bacterium]|nr:UDP-N-acetylglucosamine--N-acetylmuramyl-(pentapeptide) pyrophosphoryl-undecaprenol N-acetylglucosamine transferase [Gemmatimonadota bacterium]